MRQTEMCLLIGLVLLTAAVSFAPWATAAQGRCAEWMARIVSMEGSVEVKQTGHIDWVAVKPDETFCPGDTVRVLELSRAAVVLSNEAILRIDEKTTITFTGFAGKDTALVELLNGVVNFFSRRPRSLKVSTPFVNAAVEGTEFLIRVEPDQTFISILKGSVAATSDGGSLHLSSGQSAKVRRGRGPVAVVEARPKDAVNWALYYPPVLDFRPETVPGGAESVWGAALRQSSAAYREKNLPEAFAALDTIPENERNSHTFAFRAALMLAVGRVAEARADIEHALNLDPVNAQAFALRSVIAVAQNEKDMALELAGKAVALDAGSIAARIALSYAQQANFDIPDALATLREAVRLDPLDALAWARLAELLLSVGKLDNAIDAADRAVSLDPKSGRAQSILGFAFLTRIKIPKSKEAFNKAILLSQSDPLPRLGLGLAMIRDGDLKAGQMEIQIAAGLDPNNSLIRSYLGKVYFDERHNRLAKEQYALAKELDPLDPTPWFYDAIRKQTMNNPVEALEDLQKSIELNDNLAVYRSRLLLDQDLGARSASLARIFGDLGFDQLGLAEGWKALGIDPASFSAHRFLADAYANQPRYEIAKASELLQSQLLQPINITPVQPQLGIINPAILEGAGPADPAFNEFNPLFNRNRLALQASGVVGGNSILGDEVVQSGVLGKFSYSLGQFHYETSGIRTNNDLNLDVYNLFAQASLSEKTSVQTEFRSIRVDHGDLGLKFTGEFEPFVRNSDSADSVRLGLRHSFTPSSTLLASMIYQNGEFDLKDPQFGLELNTGTNEYLGEMRYLYDSKGFHITAGFGHNSLDERRREFFQVPLPGGNFVTQYSNLYVYSQIDVLESVQLTLGASGDIFDGSFKDEDKNQFNPKVGLTWTPWPGTTFRAAAFRTLQKRWTSEQTVLPTLEPTEVAGFNQLFLDSEGTSSWRYGAGVDRKLAATLFGGMEFSARDLDTVILPQEESLPVLRSDWKEKLGRAYLYWAPHPSLVLGGEYLYEWWDISGPTGVMDFTRLQTHRFPVSIRYFHSCGLLAGVRTTFIHQDGDFNIQGTGGGMRSVPGSDDFWVLDGWIGYRLPERYGIITLEGRNLLDQHFRFEDTDPWSPRTLPKSVILLRLTLAF